MSRRAKTIFHCFSSDVNLFITWPLRIIHFWDEFVVSDAFLETTFLALNHVVSFGANCSQPLKRAMNGKNDAQVLSHHILHVFFRSTSRIKPGLGDGRLLFCALITTALSMPRSWRRNGLCLIDLFTIQADVAFSHGRAGYHVGLPRQSFAAISNILACIHLWRISTTTSRNARCAPREFHFRPALVAIRAVLSTRRVPPFAPCKNAPCCSKSWLPGGFTGGPPKGVFVSRRTEEEKQEEQWKFLMGVGWLQVR